MKIASLVPIPDIDIGINEITLEIETHDIKYKTGTAIPRDNISKYVMAK